MFLFQAYIKLQVAILSSQCFCPR